MNMPPRRTLDTPRPPRAQWRTPQALSYRQFGESARRPTRPAAIATGIRFAELEPEDEEAKLEEALDEEAKPAAAGAEGVGRATAEAAHDFNNLLSVILTCAGELETLGLDETQLERVAEIRAAAERGAILTRDMIDTARSESRSRRPVPVDLAAAVRGSRGLLERTVGDGIEVRIQLEGGLPMALFPPGGIETVLLNLAANARDAMPARGALAVRAGLATVGVADPHLAPGWYARLLVSDSGCGMHPRLLRRAPEPYFTTKGERGSGLGLPTVFGLARGVGGDVRIESVVGRGTSVAVFLPAVRPGGGPLTLAPRV
jgi:signal transduction histidine kinase